MFVSATGRRRTELLFVGWAHVQDGEPAAPYAWWPADKSLINLTPFEGGGDLGWLRRKARIDLDADVAPSEADVAGSTFMVTRAWAERVRGDCARGSRFVVRRPPRSARQGRRASPAAHAQVRAEAA